MRLYLPLLLLSFLPLTPLNAQSDARFLSQPSLSPDGKSVLFSFEGDIWKANVHSGAATRLTGMQGYESGARYSPDGNWVAFTGTQFGNPDVYVMPSGGGDIRQLTWFSGTDQVSSWSWDSRRIYFTSGRLSRISTYTVDVQGGTARAVFPRHFFLNDHNLFEDPASPALFFNDTWESSSQVSRKQYKGPYNPDIQSYNPVTGAYKRFTDWEGKDFGATMDRRGNLYFISDEANGEYNLYTMKGTQKLPLTSFKNSIKHASVNADGGSIVFEKDYQLWLFDVATAKSRKLDISVLKNNLLQTGRDFNVSGKVTEFDISPDGKKIAFVSRGEIFVSNAEGKFIQLLNNGSVERIGELKWLSDNRTLLFNQTWKGFTNWFTIAADGTGGLKQITSDRQNNRSIVMNAKRTKAVYLSGRNDVRLLDLKRMESKTLLQDEIWGFDNGSSLGFSPDDAYVVFNAYRNFERDILIHHLATGKTTNLTKTGVSEGSPIWSPDGRYIYFSSSRLKPSYPAGPQDMHIYRMALQNFDSLYLADQYYELFREADTSKKGKEAAKKKEESIVRTEVDPTRIMDRIELVGHSSGNQDLVAVLQKEGVTTVIYSSNTTGKPELYRTVYKPFEEPKTDKMKDLAPGGLGFVSGNGKHFVLNGGKLFTQGLEESPKSEEIALSYTFRRQLGGEFVQIFEEAWAEINENYYDEHFHGSDWNAVREYYGAFLPYLNNRNDLRILINDMLGELNSSHLGFNSAGEDEKTQLTNATMETGILFHRDRPFEVDYVVYNTPADKMNIDIRKGDILTEVNGVEVDPKTDRYFYFTNPSLDKELSLVFLRGKQKIRTIVRPKGDMINELYDEWIDANQEIVDKKTNKRVAYTAMKNMGKGELDKFIIDMTRELQDKQGLIIDLRYNTGGNVHDDVLKFLSQRSYLQWKYREGNMTRQPNFAPSDHPIVLLINEQSLSDAEMTAQGFKALKLGKIIGNETYRWIIFTSGVSMVDGSTLRMPSWGCYTLDGKDLERTGVSPDIHVINTFADKISGRDPQLERAIREVLAGRGGK